MIWVFLAIYFHFWKKKVCLEDFNCCTDTAKSSPPNFSTRGGPAWPPSAGKPGAAPGPQLSSLFFLQAEDPCAVGCPQQPRSGVSAVWFLKPSNRREGLSVVQGCGAYRCREDPADSAPHSALLLELRPPFQAGFQPALLLYLSLSLSLTLVPATLRQGCLYLWTPQRTNLFVSCTAGMTRCPQNALLLLWADQPWNTFPRAPAPYS